MALPTNLLIHVAMSAASQSIYVERVHNLLTHLSIFNSKAKCLFKMIQNGLQN